MPQRSLAWWAIVACALAAVGAFMLFEVWDLDGSDLYHRLFQPPIPAQSPLVDAERTLRLGVFCAQDTEGGTCATRISLERPFSVADRLRPGPHLQRRRPAGFLRGTGRAPVGCPSSASLDDSSRLFDPTV